MSFARYSLYLLRLTFRIETRSARSICGNSVRQDFSAMLDVVLRGSESKLIQGLKNLRGNPAMFKEIFAQYNCPDMQASYGQAYIDKIYSWYENTKIPVLQAWSFDTSKIPGFSVHLADESEDESKAA